MGPPTEQKKVPDAKYIVTTFYIRNLKNLKKYWTLMSLKFIRKNKKKRSNG